MIKCPKCGSKNIDQYRTIIGAIWCADCHFRVEHKETYNPFIQTADSIWLNVYQYRTNKYIATVEVKKEPKDVKM